MESELLSLIDTVVREKQVHEDDVFYSLEHALLDAAVSRYGSIDLKVHIDRNTGKITLSQHCEVVEDNPDHQQIALKKAKLIDKEAKIGDKVPVILPLDNFSRIATKSATNLLYKKLEELRRMRECSEFQDRIGEVFTCIVKQTFYDGQMIVTHGKGIGIIKREDIIPSEKDKYKPGSTIKAYLKVVKKDQRHQLEFSRTHNQFLVKLLTLQVPEIEQGEIVIKGVVREPGRRAKIAVYADSPSIDPVRACVGSEGTRIKPVSDELNRERIDIIPWVDNKIKFAVNAMKPAVVKQVIFRGNNLILIVDEDEKRRAIGEHGNNIRLASTLTQTNLSVLTEQESVDRKIELQRFFESALDIESAVSDLLVDKGFETIADLNKTAVTDLSNSLDIEEELAEALKERCQDFSQRTKQFFESAQDIDKRLIEVPGLRTLYLQKLYENGIKTLTDLSMKTAEIIQEILSEYTVTKLSSEKFINFAKRKLGKETFIRTDPNDPTKRRTKNTFLPSRKRLRPDRLS